MKQPNSWPALLLFGLLALLWPLRLAADAGETASPAAGEAPAAAAPEEAARTAQVTYVTASSVYLDCGIADGLRAGDLVQLLGDGGVVLDLRVREVSSDRAVCVPAVEGEPLGDRVRVGDRVRFLPATAEPPPPEGPSATPAAAASGSPPAAGEASTAPGAAATAEAPPDGGSGDRRAGGIRGRVGLAYLLVKDRVETDNGFSRPALTLRLDGENVSGSPFGFHLDTRMRRTTRGSDSESDSRNRIYRLALDWQAAGSPYRLSLGRQYLPLLSGVSLIDGLLAERRTDRWALGLFAGNQTDIEDYDFSSDVRQYGLYVSRAGAPEAEGRWEVTGGLSGSYFKGENDREFVFLQAHCFSPRWTASFYQDVDYNRGWKSDAGQSTVSPTSTFAMARYQVSETLTLDAGYDNRKQVLLYRDFTTPETEFDDANRVGLWGGFQARLGRRLRLGGRYHGSSGGDPGSAGSFTATGDIERLYGFDLDLHLRSTRFTNDLREGWLHSLSADWPLGRRAWLSAFGGLRDDSLAGGVTRPDYGNQLIWMGVDFDVLLGRSWMFLLSLEHDLGDDQDYDQLYTTLSYRF